MRRDELKMYALHCTLPAETERDDVTVIAMAALWAFINHFSVLFCLLLPFISCPLCINPKKDKKGKKVRKPCKTYLMFFKGEIHVYQYMYMSRRISGNIRKKLNGN